MANSNITVASIGDLFPMPEEQHPNDDGNILYLINAHNLFF